MKSKWVPTKEKRANLLERERRTRQERIIKAREEERRGWLEQRERRGREYEDADDEQDQGTRTHGAEDVDLRNRRWKKYSSRGPPRGVDRHDALSLV